MKIDIKKLYLRNRSNYDNYNYTLRPIYYNIQRKLT